MIFPRDKERPLALAALLGVSAISACGFLAPSAAPVVAATKVSQADPTWKVTVPGNGDPWNIAYGPDGNSPQYAALDPKSGYFRLVCKTTWGTSIVLTPCFWSGGALIQGMPLDATSHVEGDRLVIDATGSRGGLKAILKVAVSPPGDGRITAEVWGRVEGTVALDTRPGEAFKVVMLSSMRVGASAAMNVSKRWDARSVLIDDRPPLGFDDTAKQSGFFLGLTPKTSARRFGLVGGKSKWQLADPAPTVEVLLDAPMQVAGFRTLSCDPDDDNLGLWAASDTLVPSWHYTVTASLPSE